MARSPEATKTPTLARVRELLSDAATPVVHLLEDHGYTSQGWEEPASEFGPSLYLVFANNRVARKVRIGLAWVEGAPVANLSLIRIPRKSIGDHLILALFAEANLPGFDRQALLIDSGRPVQEEIRRVFDLYAELLEGPAAPILRGEAWEEGHYTDWTQ